MIGLAIGAGALLGIAFYKHARMRRAYAYGWGHGCGHHMHLHGMHGHGPWGGFGGGPWGGGPWGGGPWGGPPWARRGAHLYAALAALDLSPAQEKLVRTEFAALRDQARALRPELKQSREDLGRAVGGAVFDKATIDGVFARHDRALADLRAAFTGALERIHAALDDAQRERLAQLIDRGAHRGGGPGGGPYRV